MGNWAKGRKDAECERNDEDGHSMRNKYLTHSGTGLVCFSNAVS